MMYSACYNPNESGGSVYVVCRCFCCSKCLLFMSHCHLYIVIRVYLHHHLLSVSVLVVATMVCAWHPLLVTVLKSHMYVKTRRWVIFAHCTLIDLPVGLVNMVHLVTELRAEINKNVLCLLPVDTLKNLAAHKSIWLFPVSWIFIVCSTGFSESGQNGRSFANCMLMALKWPNLF